MVKSYKRYFRTRLYTDKLSQGGRRLRVEKVLDSSASHSHDCYLCQAGKSLSASCTSNLGVAWRSF